MAAPTLKLSQQPSSVDIDEIKIIEITTNASDFQVVSANDSIRVEKILTTAAGVANKSFKLIGVRQGDPTRISVAASLDGEQKITEFFCQCYLVPTSLRVGNIKNTVKVGESFEVEVSTNASDFNINFSNRHVLRIVEKSNQKVKFECIGLGQTNIDFIATKKYSTEKKHTVLIESTKASEMDKDRLPTSLSLYNPSTKKKVTFTTTNDQTHGDVVLHLPAKSGQLLTEDSIGTDISLVAKPAIITPYNKIVNYDGEFVCSGYKTMLNFSEPLSYVEWEVSLNNTFTEIVQTLKVDANTDKNKGLVVRFGVYGAFFIRVRHVAGKTESAWSDPLECSIAYKGPYGLNKPKRMLLKRPPDDTYSKLENMYYGGYFGLIPHSDLVDDYDYRGNLETIMASYKKEYFLNNRDLASRKVTLVNGGEQSIKDRFPGVENNESFLIPIYFRKGYQVSWKGKLYYATRNMKNTVPTSGDASEVVTPDNPDKSKNFWQLDNRTNLGTPRHVFWERLNIGFGNSSSAQDGYGTGDVKLGNLINHEEGYLKYIYKGKICYTTPKPICDHICWNDIAKVELWCKQRTVRLGGTLYYARLMYETEFKELFDRLRNGTYMDTTEYKENFYALDKKVWLYDTRFFKDESKKVVRKTIKRTGSDWVVEEVDPKLRTGMSLRLVLERCEESEAPYNNIASIYGTNLIPAENEKLQYDPYTDTGYFGTTAYGVFGKTQQLQSETGVGSSPTGHDQDNPCWLKFYWHGIIIYTPKKPLTYNMQYQHAVNAGAVVGVDMGGKDGKVIIRGGTNYRVGLMTAWSHSPVRWRHYYYNTGSNTNWPVENIFTEQNRYSMYQELWLRVCRKYAGYDMAANPADNYSDHYNRNGNHYSVQIGDNWAEYNQAAIIGSNRFGYGSYRQSREVGTYNGSLNHTGGYGYETILHSSLGHSFSNTNANHSWCPAIMPNSLQLGVSD